MLPLRVFNLSRVRCFSTTSVRPIRCQIKRTVNVVFGKYLLATNIISSGVLMAIGDVVQQEIEYQRKMLPERYDYVRTGRMFIVGLALGPLHHYVYGWLNSVLPKRNLQSVMKKIMFDQFVMSPLCITTFFYGMGFLEGKSLGCMNDEITGKFIEVYMMDWTIWPPTQFINFYFLPLKYQVFYINAVTMLYNVFLSYIKHKEAAQEYSAKLLLQQSSNA